MAALVATPKINGPQGVDAVAVEIIPRPIVIKVAAVAIPVAVATIIDDPQGAAAVAIESHPSAAAVKVVINPHPSAIAAILVPAVVTVAVTVAGDPRGAATAVVVGAGAATGSIGTPRQAMTTEAVAVARVATAAAICSIGTPRAVAEAEAEAAVAAVIGIRCWAAAATVTDDPKAVAADTTMIGIGTRSAAEAVGEATACTSGGCMIPVSTPAKLMPPH